MSYSGCEAYAVRGADDADSESASGAAGSMVLEVGGGGGSDGDVMPSSSCYEAYGGGVAAGSVNSAASIGAE